MERLVIRADANTQIGTGHFMRCLSLAQAWKDAGGDITFITACQSKGLLQRLHDEGFDIKTLSKSYPNETDWYTTRDLLDSYPCAWIVLDGYQFDEYYQRQVKLSGHRLLVIDDMSQLKCYYADIILNQNYNAEQLYYACSSHAHLLLGTRYVLLRREFIARKERQREVSEVVRRVLVTLGGSDPENSTLKVIHSLQEVGILGLEAKVVIGASNPHASILEKAAKKSCIPIRLVYDTRNMIGLMEQADVVVIAGGATLWESLFMGCIVISYDRNSTQENILSQMGRKNVLKYNGHLGQMDVSYLSSTIRDISCDQKKRYDISIAGRQVVDGKGAERILGVING
jgi:UDP-2,4-diacetamido-2,4,6-trideoxy-beta-L-altropyranose hydrolase